MTVDYRIEQSILIVTVEGEWNLSLAKQAQDKSASLIRENAIRGELIDLRKAQIKFTMADAYSSTADVFQKFLVGTRHAVLRSVEDLAGEQFASNIIFIENVAANRGIQEKVFFDYDEAIAWLLS